MWSWYCANTKDAFFPRRKPQELNMNVVWFSKKREKAKKSYNENLFSNLTPGTIFFFFFFFFSAWIEKKNKAESCRLQVVYLCRKDMFLQWNPLHTEILGIDILLIDILSLYGRSCRMFHIFYSLAKPARFYYSLKFNFSAKSFVSFLAQLPIFICLLFRSPFSCRLLK